MKPFEFLAEARDPISARELGERARRAEALGYHALVVPNHVLDQLSPAPALAVIAAATERLRVGASSSTTTSATPPCWPRTWHPWTC